MVAKTSNASGFGKNEVLGRSRSLLPPCRCRRDQHSIEGFVLRSTTKLEISTSKPKNSVGLRQTLSMGKVFWSLCELKVPVEKRFVVEFPNPAYRGCVADDSLFVDSFGTGFTFWSTGIRSDLPVERESLVVRAASSTTSSIGGRRDFR